MLTDAQLEFIKDYINPSQLKVHEGTLWRKVNGAWLIRGDEVYTKVGGHIRIHTKLLRASRIIKYLQDHFNEESNLD